MADPMSLNEKKTVALNLKLFTVMTVHDRVKESFEPIVCNNCVLGFYLDW